MCRNQAIYTNLAYMGVAPAVQHKLTRRTANLPFYLMPADFRSAKSLRSVLSSGKSTSPCSRMAFASL